MSKLSKVRTSATDRILQETVTWYGTYLDKGRMTVGREHANEGGEIWIKSSEIGMND